MSGEDSIPQTPEEALARGYRPIEDLNAYIRLKLGISEAELAQRRQAFNFTIGVDCADPANLNRVCRRDDGLGIICYCGVNKNCNCFGR